MTSTMPRPSIVTFSSRSGLGITMPPSKPPVLPRFGSYCFKATVDVMDDTPGCPVHRAGRMTGYDTDLLVGNAVETACRAHVKTLGGKKRYSCGDARVVMLSNHANMQCNGEMFFELTGGAVKRLV